MDTDLSTLLMEASYASHQERWHQSGCRAYRNGTDCLACDEYEQAWIAADRALDAFQTAHKLQEAS